MVVIWLEERTEKADHHRIDDARKAGSDETIGTSCSGPQRRRKGEFSVSVPTRGVRAVKDSRC